MIDDDPPTTGDGPQGPSPIGEPPPAPAPRPALAGRIDSLLQPLADNSIPGDRACLHDALLRQFGPDFEGAVLDRDAIRHAADRAIAAIDARLSDQVSAILHAPLFQALEARWRGLRYITDAASGSERVKVRLLSASWGDIVRDLERAADFDQSNLFRKIYTEEFGMPGGEPFGLIIGDYEVQHRPSEGHPTDDRSALASLSVVGAAAFCPFIVGASPRIFQLDSFRELGRPNSLQTVFAQPEYVRWNSMREEEDTRFIGIVLPRILMRPAYGFEPSRVDGFCFTETPRSGDRDTALWGNAAFAFGSIVIRAFAANGWFADLRGAPRDQIRGGLVTDLQVTAFATDAQGIATKPSIEFQMSEAQERDLGELGFMALRRAPYTDYSVFYANPSLQKPRRYDRPAATMNAKLSSMLQYTLCVSRFAHYIKVLGRDRIGSTMTAEQCQTFLNKWLVNYCEGSESSTDEVKARYPLREASVEVRESPSKPGSYSCTVFLRPHYQLDDISTGFRLITELAPKLAA